MITSFDSKPQGRISFCAAMHNRDKTLRAQIVEKSSTRNIIIIELFL